MIIKSGRSLFFNFLVSFLLTLGLTAGCASTSTYKKPTGSTQTSQAKAEKKRLWGYKKTFYNLYSKQSDVKIGEYVMAQQLETFDDENISVDSSKYATLRSRVQGIVNRLARVSDEPSFPYEVHIIDEPNIINAYCLPGGKIGVFTGLFDSNKGLVSLNNNDEWAAILGHEIAHATMRHVTRRISTLRTFGFIGSLASIGISAGAGSNAQQLFDTVFNVGANLFLPGYSRKYEKEADQAGLYYMTKAGFNPQAAVNVWKRAASYGGTNSKKTHFFASHPASGVRAKNLEKFLPDARLVQQRKAP